MRRSIIVLIVSAVAYLAAAVAPAQSEPFYCDRVGPDIEQSDTGLFDSVLAVVGVESALACGSTGVCLWQEVAPGLWIESCFPPPGCTRPTGCG